MKYRSTVSSGTNRRVMGGLYKVSLTNRPDRKCSWEKRETRVTVGKYRCQKWSICPDGEPVVHESAH